MRPGTLLTPRKHMLAYVYRHMFADDTYVSVSRIVRKIV